MNAADLIEIAGVRGRFMRWRWSTPHPTSNSHSYGSNRLVEHPTCRNTPTIELQYKGRNCIQCIKEYKNSPWFLSSSQVAPNHDILSSDGNFVGVFDIPDPAVVEDDVAFFKGIAACLQFLASRHLALTEVNMKTFCKSNDKHQVCKLSPHCLVMADPDGSQLTENRKDIFDLSFY